MAKADLHMHSIYSEHPSEWFLQRLGAAESYTQPRHIWKELKKQGMDFVTITDHNRIDGAQLLKQKYPDKVLMGVEATAYFPEDNCKVHILIYGLNRTQYEQVQELRTNIYELREYLKQEDLACSVAHATYAVNKRLTMEHLEKLLLLFDVFETINGGRNDLHNNSWNHILHNLTPQMIQRMQQKHNLQTWSDTPWIKGFTGGSDDHAGIFLGRTYTIADARTPEEFLQQIKERKTTAAGRHNDYQGLAFTVYKIALEFMKTKSKSFSTSFFSQVTDYLYEDKNLSLKNRIKLKTLKNKVSADEYLKATFADLIETLQDSKNLDLEEKFRIAYGKVSDLVDSFFKVLFQSFEENISQGNLLKIIRNISSSLPGIFFAAPFYTTIHHMFCNRQLIDSFLQEYGICEPQREKNILWFTDTINDLNGVSVTLDRVHHLSQKNDYNVIIVGSHTSRQDDSHYINLPLMHTFDLPYYEHQNIRVPSPLAAMEKIYRAHPDKIIISTPGPIGLMALLAARLFHIPAIGIYHTDFKLQLKDIRDDESLLSIVDGYTHWFYEQMDTVYVPSRAYCNILEERGLDRSRMKVFPRGIDYETFFPVNYGRAMLMDAYNLKQGAYLLYTGRISHDKNLGVILQAFMHLAATRDDVYLLLVGDGPHRKDFEKQFSHERIIFTGKVPRSDLPKYYSGADLFLFPSTSDTFGMSVLEAQACCLPAFVSDKGGPREIIEDGITGKTIASLNPREWHDHIERYLSILDIDPHKIRDMKTASREKVQQKSDWKKFFAEFIH